jgi:ATP-binding cassette subfamily B (MDR/TAP) protein 1
VITHDVSQILPEDYVYVLEKSQVVQEGYQKSMQSNTGSPFETFLSSQVDGVAEVDESQDNLPNDLLSLYADPKSSSDSWDATSRHPPSLLDPLDMYLEEREELDLPTRRTVFSVHLGTPSQRNSIAPHVASPYQEQGICSPIEATPEVILRYGKTAARSQLSSPNVRRPGPLSFIHSSDYSAELRTKHRSQRKRKKQKPEAVVALPMTAILSTVWLKLDWMSRILLVVAFFCSMHPCQCHARVLICLF